MHYLKVILILLLKNISSEVVHLYNYTDLVVNATNDEVSSISSQIDEQIKVLLEVVLSKVSKLVQSLISMRQGEQRKHSFLEKKELHKTKNGSAINKHREIFCQSMDRVMK